MADENTTEMAFVCLTCGYRPPPSPRTDGPDDPPACPVDGGPMELVEVEVPATTTDGSGDPAGEPTATENRSSATIQPAAATSPVAGTPSRVRSGRLTFAEFRIELLPGERMMLGRDPEFSQHADFFGRYDAVSRRHAEIHLDLDGILWIRDEYATNHTRINVKRLRPGASDKLRDGDTIRFCSTLECTVDLVREGSSHG